jgi:adenine-specific DNA-methyltransferase
MPTLQFKGKNIIWNHHLSVPYHSLEEIEDLSFQPEKGEGNLIVEGDNLIALKALLPQFGGSIKCIYIDPPYNTQKQTWVYSDNVNSPMIKEWFGKTVDKDDLTRHDKWLCMMIPRLKSLWELLAVDGLLFISIDDHEYHNLKNACDDCFGSNAYLTTLIWNTEGHTDNQYQFKVNHEYILVYIKDEDQIDNSVGYVVDPNTREESNLWKGFAENSITKNGSGNPPSEIKLKAGFPVRSSETKTLESNKPNSQFFEEIKSVGYITRSMTKAHNVKYPIRFDEMVFKNNRLEKACIVYSGWANANKLKKFNENGFKPIEEKDGKVSFFLSENGVIYYHKERDKARHIVSVLRDMGTTEQMKYYLEQLGLDFDYPKPIDLIKYVLKIGGDENAIVLDSFAGSGTTMQAAMDLNKEDGGDRQCILVQMTEATSNDPEKNVCRDITRERIVKSISKEKYQSGFKYLRVGSPIDPETMLDGDLPTYQQFAEYVYYLATGGHLADKTKVDASKYFVGMEGGQAVYLIYEQDMDKLTRLALTLQIAESIVKHSPGKRRVVFAPSCFLDEEYMTAMQIEFVSVPYNLFERKNNG